MKTNELKLLLKLSAIFSQWHPAQVVAGDCSNRLIVQWDAITQQVTDSTPVGTDSSERVTLEA